MKILMMIALVLCLTACGTKQNGASYTNPAFNSEKSVVLNFVAGEIAQTLATQYPAGQTSIYLTPTKDKKSGFSALLEEQLRQRGFTVIQEPQINALQITYTLDLIKDTLDAYYLRLKASDGFNFARGYTGTTPEIATQLFKGV